MRNSFLLLTFFICTASFSQTFISGGQSTFGGGEGMDVASDGINSAYITGEFDTPTLNFGSITLVNNGSGTTSDIFLSKIRADGTTDWALSAGGTGTDIGYAVSTDDSSNVYVTGTFSSDPIVFGNDSFHNAGGGDFFIAKYDSSGNYKWAFVTGSIGGEVGHSVTCDVNGNVEVVGSFSHTVSFGLYTLSTTATQNIFTAKFTSGGTVLWAKKAGGNGQDQGMGITTDPSGNIITTGLLSAMTASFGSFTLNNTNNSGTDVFLAKYDPNGNEVWAENFGSTCIAEGVDVTTNSAGNIFATGNYDSTITFGNYSLVGNSNTSGDQDIFVAAFDQFGTPFWAKSSQSLTQNLTVSGFSISCDAYDNPIMTGGFFTTNELSFDFDTLHSGGPDPMCLVEFSAVNGNVICLSALPSGGDDANSISIKNNLAFIGGDFWDTLVFGADSLFGNTHECAFVGRFSPCPAEGINDLNSDHTLLIYPNPSSGIFSINWNDHFVPGTKIEIYDELGRMILSKNMGTETEVINLASFSKGLYFYRLATNTKLIGTGKLVTN